MGEQSTGAGKKTRSVVLEVIEASDRTPLDKVLLCWRIRGRNLETPLPFNSLRVKPVGGQPRPEDMEVRLYVYRHSRGEEYVICGPVRGEEDDQAKRLPSNGSPTGILHDVSRQQEEGNRGPGNGCGPSDSEGV